MLIGLERLAGEFAALVGGRRVALLAHPASRDRDGQHAADVLRAAGATVTVLLAPEHGWHGLADPEQPVADEVEPTTARPIVSLYRGRAEPTVEPPIAPTGSARRDAPLSGRHADPYPELGMSPGSPPAMDAALSESGERGREAHHGLASAVSPHLAGVDLVVVDLQDIGARHSSYPATVLACVRAGARVGRPIAILDRPNPLGGATIEGPILTLGDDPEPGLAGLPIRHGLTTGELVRRAMRRERLDVELTIIELRGWRRGDDAAATGRRWLAPTPSLGRLSAVALYPGTCLAEGLLVSEGRGTNRPFEQIGAPDLDAVALVERLRPAARHGVRLEPIAFTPAHGELAGQLCRGVRFSAAEPSALRSVAVGLHLVAALRAIGAPSTAWRHRPDGRLWIDRLAGAATRRAIDDGAEPAAIVAEWSAALADYARARRDDLLY